MCITKQATKRGILGIALNAGKYVLRDNVEHKRAKKKTAYRDPKKDIRLYVLTRCNFACKRQEQAVYASFCFVPVLQDH